MPILDIIYLYILQKALLIATCVVRFKIITLERKFQYLKQFTWALHFYWPFVNDKRPSPLIFFLKIFQTPPPSYFDPHLFDFTSCSNPPPTTPPPPPLIRTPRLLGSQRYVQSALLILFFHNKLLFYNDIE